MARVSEAAKNMLLDKLLKSGENYKAKAHAIKTNATPATKGIFAVLLTLFIALYIGVSVIVPIATGVVGSSGPGALGGAIIGGIVGGLYYALFMKEVFVGVTETTINIIPTNASPNSEIIIPISEISEVKIKNAKRLADVSFKYQGKKYALKLNKAFKGLVGQDEAVAYIVNNLK